MAEVIKTLTVSFTAASKSTSYEIEKQKNMTFNNQGKIAEN